MFIKQEDSSPAHPAGSVEPGTYAVVIALAFVCFFVTPAYLVTKSVFLTVAFVVSCSLVLSVMLLFMSLPWIVARLRRVSLSKTFMDVFFRARVRGEGPALWWQMFAEATGQVARNAIVMARRDMTIAAGKAGSLLGAIGKVWHRLFWKVHPAMAHRTGN